MPRLLSVNVGLPREVTWNGTTVRTAIWKLPVDGLRIVRKLNLDGEAQADLAGHGGEQRAVFVYQMDSNNYWKRFLGRDDLSFGQFGENFTVEGLADDEVCIGDQYRIGSAVFEVTQPRVTCYRVGIRMKEPRMPALLVAHHRRGFYFRVLREGERLQTTASGVWAIGEVAGSPQFTHISVDDFRVVHANVIGGNRVTTGRHVPYCLFTDPESARVGLNETEAKARDISYRLFKVPMEANLRARTLSETRGFLKALVEATSDRIIGFTDFGVGAAEIMSAVQIAMIAGLPYTVLSDAVLTHPTLVEGLIPLFSSVPSAHGVVDATSTTGA